MKPILLLLILALSIFAYDPDHIDSDSCKTVLHNSNWCTPCVNSDRDRVIAAALSQNITPEQYINNAIIERLEYDEEQYYFKTGRILK